MCLEFILILLLAIVPSLFTSADLTFISLSRHLPCLTSFKSILSLLTALVTSFPARHLDDGPVVAYSSFGPHLYYVMFSRFAMH